MAKFIVTLVVETDANEKPPTKKSLKAFILRALGMDFDRNDERDTFVDLLINTVRVRSVDID